MLHGKSLLCSFQSLSNCCVTHITRASSRSRSDVSDVQHKLARISFIAKYSKLGCLRTHWSCCSCFKSKMWVKFRRKITQFTWKRQKLSGKHFHLKLSTWEKLLNFPSSLFFYPLYFWVRKSFYEFSEAFWYFFVNIDIILVNAKELVRENVCTEKEE